MPTYEYQCAACGHRFELFQQMSDPVRRKCPKCEKLKLERLIGTGAGVLFKGSGFYETDYRSESYRKAAEAETKPAGDDKKGSSDAKPTAASNGESKSKTKSESKKPKSGES